MRRGLLLLTRHGMCEPTNLTAAASWTIATWFFYRGSGAKQYLDIVELTEAVLDDKKANWWSCAHDHCGRPVHLAVEKHDPKADLSSAGRKI
jgi:hypothetical protein